MGCFNSKNNSKVHIANIPVKETPKQPNEKSKENNENKENNDVEFKITTADMVGERTTKISKDYTILSPALGKGAFGEVRKAIHKATGMTRAIKIISKAATSQEEQDKLINEVEILKKLDHPNIIKVYEFYQDDKYFYIVTELCTGGELFDQIMESKFFSEKRAAQVFKQIMSSVYYCHQHNIVHRDLKPENLLLENNSQDALIKVIDFGTSRTFDTNKKMNQKFGTPYYIAPEVLKKKYDEKCDIWSCGVILYILLSGYPPFNGSSDEQIMQKVRIGKFDFNGEEWRSVSKEAKEFISKMLCYDPYIRLSAGQCMEDPWLKKFNSKNTIDIKLQDNALTNLRNFRVSTKLQDASWMFLVNYLASKEEKKQLLQTFQSMDLNGDGQLSRQELIEGYKKTMNEPEALQVVDQIMSIVDKDNSGFIDYTEFVMATINREKLLSKEKLEMAFKMFDKDGSGQISILELKENFGGNKIPDNIWKEIVLEVDEKGNGEISYQAFKNMMLKLLN